MSVEIDLRQRLDGCKHVPALLRSLAVDEQLAERAVAEDGSVGVQTLGQDLAAMRNEEQTWILQMLPQSPIVECRHQRLAGAGRGYHEVSRAVMPFTLRFQALQHLALERPGLQVEMKDLRRLRNDGRPHSAIKPVGVARGIVRLVVGIGPVALECGLELLDQIRCRCLRKTHVPLDSVEQGAMRQIR